jgi:PadR family transcriptional regulator, regulatory protein AphA
MSSVRLGPTSYVVLGSIAIRGPSTSYDLKRFVELTLGHFWTFPHSQLYAEPDRLASAGLLTEEREEGGRRRRTYGITEAGRRALGTWLNEPATAQVELRDLGMVKLFFSELTDDDALRALAREQAAAHRATLARYEWLKRRYGDRPEYARRMLPLEAGFRMEHALIGFWEDVARNWPDEAAAALDEQLPARRTSELGSTTE